MSIDYVMLERFRTLTYLQKRLISTVFIFLWSWFWKRDVVAGLLVSTSAYIYIYTFSLMNLVLSLHCLMITLPLSFSKVLTRVDETRGKNKQKQTNKQTKKQRNKTPTYQLCVLQRVQKVTTNFFKLRISKNIICNVKIDNIFRKKKLIKLFWYQI